MAVPLLWEEFHQPGMHAGRFTILDVPQRLARMEDPWTGRGKWARGQGRPRWVLDRMMEVGGEGNAA